MSRRSPRRRQTRCSRCGAVSVTTAVRATCTAARKSSSPNTVDSFPRSSTQLMQLPGIGRSTAAAIAAFCFGERVAILDGNVKRVLTRVLGFGDDLVGSRFERALWAKATALLPERDIERYTQGVMDLGATLCSTRAPACEACPVATLCRARREGTAERYPLKTRRLERTRRENWWLWLEWRGRVWLQQRPERGVWGGLWTLPLHDDEPALDAIALALGTRLEPLPMIEHALTHFDWVLHPRRARLRESRRPALLGQGRWVDARRPRGHRAAGAAEALARGQPDAIARVRAASAGGDSAKRFGGGSCRAAT